MTWSCWSTAGTGDEVSHPRPGPPKPIETDGASSSSHPPASASLSTTYACGLDVLALKNDSTIRMMNMCKQSGRVLQQRRAFSSSCSRRAGGASESLVLSSRWLTDLRKRLTTCQSKSASSPAKSKQIESRLTQLSDRWLDLSAGREGYLTQTRWKGLDKLNVLWGDMVSLMLAILIAVPATATFQDGLTFMLQ